MKQQENNPQGNSIVAAVLQAPQLPAEGYLRLKQIVGDPGDPNAIPPKLPIPAVIPISASAWWAGVKDKRFPQSIKLGPRTTVWRVEDIRVLIQGAKS